jgi:hypothetical protein
MPTIDFLTFWSVPHALLHQQIGNIYSSEAQLKMGALAESEAQSPNASNLQRIATERITRLYGGRIDVTGTPFLYTAIGWLSSGKFDADQKRFVLISSACLVLSILLLANVLDFSFVEASLLFVFIATYYAPVLADMQVGNVNEIELLGIVLFIVFIVHSQPLAAGLVIGAASMLKPMPVAIVVLAVIAWGIDREYRWLLRMLSGCLIAVSACFIASALYFGTPAIWIDFLHSLPRTLNGVSYSLQNGNFSLSASLFGATNVGSAIVPLVLLGGFAWLFIRTRARDSGVRVEPLQPAASRIHTAFAIAGGGCALTLVTSPLVWPHYFVLLLPLSIYLMRAPETESASAPKGDRVWSIAQSILPFVLFGMFSFLAELIVGNSPRNIFILFSVATLSSSGLAAHRIYQVRIGPVHTETCVALKSASRTVC